MHAHSWSTTYEKGRSYNFYFLAVKAFNNYNYAVKHKKRLGFPKGPSFDI